MTLPLASLLSLLATAAVAQTPDAPMSEPPLPSASDPCRAAEDDYTKAFDWLVKGQDEEALGALERVLAMCPSHPYASEFARLARTRLRPGAELAEAALETPALMAPEKPTGFARGGLVVWQTMHGAAQGILLCVIADCSGRAFLGVALLGAGVGSTASLLLTPNGITPGQSAAINAGTSWGVWYGVTAFTLIDFDDGNADIGVTMFSMASLTGAGIAVAMLASPTAGQVSMTNSGGLWAGVVTALFLLTSDSEDNKAFFAIESGVTSVGLISFALLSESIPISRGRVLLIDAGGILGGLLGAAAVALLTENEDPILIGAGIGTLGGLGLSTWLTRDFDTPSTGPEVTLAPTLMGREGAGLVLAGRF